MYQPPPAMKPPDGLSCPVCGEQAMTIWKRIFWTWRGQRFCRTCGVRVRRSPRSWLLLLLAIAAAGAPFLIIRLPDSPFAVPLMYLSIVGFEALLVWRFDRLRSG